MIFYYDICATYVHDDHEYYTAEEVSHIKLVQESAPTDDYWPVCEPAGYSTEPASCTNEAEARNKLLESLNLSVYERLHDL